MGQQNQNVVTARKAYFAKGSALVYNAIGPAFKDGELVGERRRWVEDGAELLDCSPEDLAGFKKSGLVEEKLVEVK